ncbi:MAG: aminotransferase class IV, partial [Actinobacteria bacterium]|nr:aminotransferase class IV [Actinomycetota bacterium]
AEDVVLVNVRSELTETTIASLAVRIGGRWWTPPLDAGLLPGIERAALLEAGTLTERPIRVEELAGAQEIAVVSSVRGFRRAVLIEPQSAGTPPSGKS